jgi:hypothetical protein
MVLPDAVLAGPRPPRSRPVYLGLAEFENHLNTRFEVIREDGSQVPLELIEARAAKQRNSNERGRRAHDADYEKFSLLFGGPHHQWLEQETYSIRHAELGELRMFIVPVLARDRCSFVYEAIFNYPRGMN